MEPFNKEFLGKKWFLKRCLKPIP